MLKPAQVCQPNGLITSQCCPQGKINTSLPGSQNLRVFPSPAGQLPQPSRTLPHICCSAHQVPEGAQAPLCTSSSGLALESPLSRSPQPTWHLQTAPDDSQTYCRALAGTQGLPDSTLGTFLPIYYKLLKGRASSYAPEHRAIFTAPGTRAIRKCLLTVERDKG